MLVFVVHAVWGVKRFNGPLETAENFSSAMNYLWCGKLFCYDDDDATVRDNNSQENIILKLGLRFPRSINLLITGHSSS